MRTRLLSIVAGIVLSAGAGCSIPKSDFHASDDAMPGGTDSGDQLGFIIDPTSGLQLTEGMSADFTVKLNHAPGGTVTVAVQSASDKIGLSVPQLTFNDSDFDQPKKVTVTGLQDKDAKDENGLLVSVSASGLETQQVQVDVKDDDTLDIVTDIPISKIVTVDEGGTVDVRVHLSAQPPSDVTITAKLGIGPVSSQPMSQVFTQLDYASDKTFTFSAANDANTVSEDVDLAFSSSVAGINDANATVHVVDKDILNIQVAPTMLTVTEQGAASQFQVSLTKQPSTNVTVNLSTTTGAVNIDTTVLTFTPQNYGTAQLVSVTAPADPDTVDGSDTIKLDAGTGIAPRTVTVTVKDDDIQKILDSAPSPLVVAENGTKTFDVWLAFKPIGSVTVNVASLNGAVATATPGTLTFDGTNYATHQTVTVKGTDDPDLVTNSTTIRLSEASIGMVDIPTNVTDDDSQVITLSKTTTTIPEPQSDTFTVKLGFDPGGTTTVNVVSNNTALVTVGTPTLTFNTSNYNIAQTVTISAVKDPDANDGDTTVSVTGAGAPAQQVMVHVKDTDVLQIATDGSGLIQVGEGTFVDIHVHLTAQPNGNVVVTPQFAVGQPLSVNPSSLTFTTSDYATDKTLRFTALQDANSTNEDITISLHPSVVGMSDASFTIQTQDDDVLNIKLVPSTTQMTERGPTATLAVSLTAQPTGATTVNLTSSSGAVTLSTSAVSFTTGNWATAQNVTMTAPGDNDTVNGSAVITATATGIPAPQTVNITVIDPDTQAIMTDAPSTLNLTETGTTSFHVWLAFQPQSTTTVNVASLDSTIATVSPGFYDFTTSDWSTHKTVTVTGVHNFNLKTNSTTVRLSEPSIGTKDIPTNVTNNDVQQIVLNPAQPSLNITEGSSATFTVKLAFDPGATVTLPVTSGNPTSLPASPASLQFSSLTYSTPQTVTVSAPIDSNQTSETTNIVVGGAPAGAADATASAKVLDQTVVTPYGWPSPIFSGITTNGDGATLIAYQLPQISTTTTLDSLAVNGSSAVGTFWLGLYTNNGGQPGTLVASTTSNGLALAAGPNIVPVTKVTLNASQIYWVVLGATSNAPFTIDMSAATTTACTGAWNPALGQPAQGLPASWSAHVQQTNCGPNQALNLWISTYHTP